MSSGPQWIAEQEEREARLEEAVAKEIAADKQPSGLKESDISDEAWREYDYGAGRVYRIEAPVKLFTREGGTGHRVQDAAGVVHWCPVNVWHVIRWKNKEGFSPCQF